MTQENTAQYGVGIHKGLANENAALSICDPIVEITGEEIERAPHLFLEVVESPTLAKGLRYEIDAGGYVKSRRRARDGCTYVGTAEHSEKPGEVSNDITIPLDEIGMGSTHFLIQYKTGKRVYQIKDFGQGTGTFIKLQKPLAVKEGYIISYGDSHMYANAINDEKIQLKFLDGPKVDQTL